MLPGAPWSPGSTCGPQRACIRLAAAPHSGSSDTHGPPIGHARTRPHPPAASGSLSILRSPRPGAPADTVPRRPAPAPAPHAPARRRRRVPSSPRPRRCRRPTVRPVPAADVSAMSPTPSTNWRRACSGRKQSAPRSSAPQAQASQRARSGRPAAEVTGLVPSKNRSTPGRCATTDSFSGGYVALGRMLRNCCNCRNLRWSECATARESRLKSFQKRKLRPEGRRLLQSASGAAICNAPCAP